MDRKWQIMTKANPPPVNEEFWGFDVFYDTVHTCLWFPSNTTDDGLAKPGIVGYDTTDVSIAFWMRKDPPPEPPNVDIREVYAGRFSDNRETSGGNCDR